MNQYNFMNAAKVAFFFSEHDENQTMIYSGHLHISNLFSVFSGLNTAFSMHGAAC